MNSFRRIAVVVVLAAVVIMPACGDDSTTPKTPTGPTFQDLSHKGHVLSNFELAHNRRDANHYDAVIDDNFTLYYTDGGVGGAGTPVQWGRSTDLPATHTLFASVDKLEFDLDTSGITWTEAPAPGGLENWYSTTVYYHFTIHMGNYTYIPNAGAKMLLTVRNAGTDMAPSWRLVELHDLGGPSLLRATQSSTTEQTTYGQVKALFK